MGEDRVAVEMVAVARVEVGRAVEGRMEAEMKVAEPVELKAHSLPSAKMRSPPRVDSYCHPSGPHWCTASWNLTLSR